MENGKPNKNKMFAIYIAHMGRKPKSKKKTSRKRRSKRVSKYPSVNNGLTLEVESLDATQLLTTALTDPYRS
jgi:hypothetical protein